MMIYVTRSFVPLVSAQILLNCRECTQFHLIFLRLIRSQNLGLCYMTFPCNQYGITLWLRGPLAYTPRIWLCQPRSLFPADPRFPYSQAQRCRFHQAKGAGERLSPIRICSICNKAFLLVYHSRSVIIIIHSSINPAILVVESIFPLVDVTGAIPLFRMVTNGKPSGARPLLVYQGNSSQDDLIWVQ